jgi:hypothetical protein
MLELSTMARNTNRAQNMHNATWGESKQEDTMYNTSLFSTAQKIHQNRERLFLELLRPSTSSEALSSPKTSDLPSIPNQAADTNYDTLLLDTITADSAHSLSEMIVARREQRRKSIASLRELRKKSESIPVMIQHLNQHQQQTQGMNTSVSHNNLSHSCPDEAPKNI